MRTWLGRDSDLNAGGAGVDKRHGFVAAAGAVDVLDFGNGALGLDTDGGGQAEAVGVVLLPGVEFGALGAAADGQSNGAPVALMPVVVRIAEPGSDGLGDFQSLFGGEPGLGEGRTGSGDHGGILGGCCGHDGLAKRIASMMRRPATPGWEWRMAVQSCGLRESQ